MCQEFLAVAEFASIRRSRIAARQNSPDGAVAEFIRIRAGTTWLAEVLRLQLHAAAPPMHRVGRVATAPPDHRALGGGALRTCFLKNFVVAAFDTEPSATPSVNCSTAALSALRTRPLRYRN